MRTNLWILAVDLEQAQVDSTHTGLPVHLKTQKDQDKFGSRGYKSEVPTQHRWTDISRYGRCIVNLRPKMFLVQLDSVAEL
jgi:hypothetical protein